MGETARKPENAVDFFRFSDSIFRLRKGFPKIPSVRVFFHTKNRTKIYTKIRKKENTKNIYENTKKHTKNWNFGEKRYCRKGVSGISKSVKNSVPKGIFDVKR